MTDQERLAAAKRDLLRLQSEIGERLRTVKDRRRANDVRLLHEVQSMLDPLNPFASQAGQDRVLDRLFKGKTGGTFVDVGGYDGVTGSNSYYFETVKNWRGILVEPVEVFRNKAEVARTCPCLPYAVAETDGEAEFIAVTEGYTQMSGLLDKYDPAMLDRVREDKRHKEEKIKVKTRTLAGLLEDQDLMAPDFVSLDIEGGELSVLKSFPFSTYRVKAWAIENNTSTPELRLLMQAEDYALVEFCGPDEIYAHKSIR